VPVIPSLELELRFQRARSPVNLPVVRARCWDDAACQNVWKMASPNGDTVSGDKAAPFIVNFKMVDTDKEARFSQQSSTPAAARVGSRVPTLRRPRK
jgi:hypothetical protein